MNITTDSTGPEAVSTPFVLLGVRFWVDAGVADRADLKTGMDSIYDALRQDSEQALTRQRRSYLAYWDALTYFELSTGSARGRSDEEELALTLGFAIEEAKLGLELAAEVAALPALAGMWTTHHYYDPHQMEVPEALLLRLSPGQLVRTGKGHRLREAGFYRQFELSLGPDGALAPPSSPKTSAKRATLAARAASGSASPRNIDWRRLLAVAVLAHLRADLEVYFESGFCRLRRCQNFACRAWFVAKPMGGRQRFCSTLCRVQHARGTARRGGR